LSLRERSLLPLLVAGQTHGEIGATWGIRPRTVETHCAHLKQKSGLNTQGDVIRNALQHGLVPLAIFPIDRQIICMLVRASERTSQGSKQGMVSMWSGSARLAVLPQGKVALYSRVALHATVEKGTCHNNGGPAILLLGILPSRARRGEPAWTPR